ncbi:MAG TPA: hypothetical protein VGM31_16260 [Puia sp.]|jgi:hypothetical protein
MNAKNRELIAATALVTLLAGVAAVTAVYVVSKKRKQKRLAVISNAGYEMAYDVHYPIRYRKTS